MARTAEIDNTEEMLNQISNLYNEVWNSGDHSLKERLSRHSTYPGFRGLASYSDNEELMGFSYGYTSLPGQFYHELLAKEFTPVEYQKWLQDCFEFVELAVNPTFRKRGLGRKLVTKLLEDAGNKTAILTTQTDNPSARALYESLGWIVIKEPFYPNGHNQPYVIMGKELEHE